MHKSSFQKQLVAIYNLKLSKTSAFPLPFIPYLNFVALPPTRATEMGRNGCKQMRMVIGKQKIPLWFLFPGITGVYYTKAGLACIFAFGEN